MLVVPPGCSQTLRPSRQPLGVFTNLQSHVKGHHEGGLARFVKSRGYVAGLAQQQDIIYCVSTHHGTNLSHAKSSPTTEVLQWCNMFIQLLRWCNMFIQQDMTLSMYCQHFQQSMDQPGMVLPILLVVS